MIWTLSGKSPIWAFWGGTDEGVRLRFGSCAFGGLGPLKEPHSGQIAPQIFTVICFDLCHALLGVLVL